MRINNKKSLVLLGIALLMLNGCSNANTTLTPAPATRGATQTPWIIYQPVTVTPEPATITPLPTVGAPPAEVKTPTRTPTKAAVVAAKTATKAPTVAIAAAPAATSTPACNLGSVAQLIWPDNLAPRKTKLSGGGGDTFDFQWTPFQPGETDTQVGYRIEIQSKVGGRTINGDIVDIQHNYFINNGKHFIYDQRRVQTLASPNGDTTQVVWTVTIIKTTGSYDNAAGKSTGTITPCGPATGPFVISLSVIDTNP